MISFYYIIVVINDLNSSSDYDTIRYDIFTCAQKLTKGQLSLAHGTKTKKIKEKLKTKAD